MSALLANISIFAQNKTLKAFYEGYDDTYLFSDANGEYTEFHEVDEKLLKQYDLQSEDLVGKAFLVTFSVSEKKDEEGFEYEHNKITALKPIQLEKAVEEDEEDSDY